MALTTNSLTYAPYNPKQGYDTIWEAQVPGWRTRAANASSDDQLARDRAQRSYEQNIYDLGNATGNTTRNTLSGLEGRGVLRSGETQQRLADISSRDTLARSRANQALLDAQNASRSQLQRQLTAIQLEQEKAKQEGLARQQQADFNAWVAATNRNQAAAMQAALLRAVNRPPTIITRTVQGALAPAAPAGPSQADLSRFYNGVTASQPKPAGPGNLVLFG